MATLDSVELGELERRLVERTAELEAANRKLQQEIIERKHAEEEIRLLLAITQTIGEARDFTSALQITLKKVCEATGWNTGEVWVSSSDGTVLEYGSAVYLSTPRLQQFREQSQEITFARDVGLPGRVWTSKQPEWIPDISVRLGSNCRRAHIAVEAGLKAAFAIPIIVNDQVLAVLAFFMFQPRKEDKRLIEMISAIALQLGSVIQRKTAEEALRESEVRLTLAQEAADIGTADWDIKSGKIHWSMHQFHLHGATPTEDRTTRSEDWLAVVHPDDQDRSVDAINSAVKTAEGFSAEYRVIWPDNQVRWLCGTARVIRDDDGRAVRILGASFDITKRKRAEEALRESEARYRSIVENAPLCIHEIDTSGRLISMNPAGLRMIGLESHNDIVGMPYLDTACSGDRRQVEQLLKRALAGEPAAFDFSADTKLGRRVFASSFNPIRTADGVIEKLMGITQDITERKCAEDQLRVSHQRLRNLATQLQAVREEERTIIAREVHDELGQALTALKMDLAWIAKSLPTRWKAVPDRLHSMISLTDSTLATVRQLSSRLRPAMLDDLGLEAAIEWQVQEFANRSDYDCRLDLKTKTLASSRKRDTAVFRIFQESLTNIARHANANRIDIKLWTKNEELLLMVKDDGKGISDEALTSVYSLGLTGMYERARSLAGSLKIERGVENKGTVLTLSVPLTSTKHLVYV